MPIERSMADKLRARVLVAAGVVLAALFLFYVYGRVHDAFAGPDIIVTSPRAGERAEERIVVSGTAPRAVAVEINGKNVPLDTEKNFSSVLLLPEGYTIIRIKVRDRFGKEKEATIPLFR